MEIAISPFPRNFKLWHRTVQFFFMARRKFIGFILCCAFLLLLIDIAHADGISYFQTLPPTCLREREGAKCAPRRFRFHRSIFDCKSPQDLVSLPLQIGGKLGFNLQPQHQDIWVGVASDTLVDLLSISENSIYRSQRFRYDVEHNFF